jgi:hypothetical protein
MPWLDPLTFRVGFLVDEMTPEHTFFSVLQFFAVSIIPPTPHIRLFFHHESFIRSVEQLSGLKQYI